MSITDSLWTLIIYLDWCHSFWESNIKQINVLNFLFPPFFHLYVFVLRDLGWGCRVGMQFATTYKSLSHTHNCDQPHQLKLLKKTTPESIWVYETRLSTVYFDSATAITRGWNRYQHKSQPWRRKFSLCSFWESNPDLSIHEWCFTTEPYQLTQNSQM